MKFRKSEPIDRPVVSEDRGLLCMMAASLIATHSAKEAVALAVAIVAEVDALADQSTTPILDDKEPA